MFEFNFLLETNTFNHNGLDKEIICLNIERLSLLREKIYSIKESLCRNEDIYNSEIIQSKKLYEVLYDETLDRDSRIMLSNIVDKAKDNIGIEVNGNIGLNYCPDIKCIYTLEDWIKYHHENLIINYKNESEFFLGLKRYFPNLEFHENIQTTLNTLEGGCQNFIKDIISSLECIDIHLENNIKSSNNLTEALKKTSSSLGLDITLEGDASRKRDLSFIFKDDENNDRSMYCESHVKLEKSSNSSDSSWYANRIYFHPGIDEIKSKKILIGYIGKHL